MSKKHPAVILLSLLEEYRMVLDGWEDHLRKKYKTKRAEKEGHLFYQSELQLPLMQRCSDCGFSWIELMDIMPHPFEGSYDDRKEIVEDLRKYAKEIYGV